jgi:zinc protease
MAIGVRTVLAVGCVAVLAGCADVPAQQPQSPARAAVHGAARGPTATRTAFEQRILPSGLRVLWDQSAPGSLAGVVAVVRGGSRLDPPGQEGLAHLVEHLTYRAVDRPAGGDPPLTRWNRLIQDAVADMNGFTTPDYLMFYELGPPLELPALVSLEVARLTDPLAGVDEQAFTLEQQIIGSEHLVRSDPRAGQWPISHVFPRLFPAGHPYARPTGGTDESRARLTLAAARSYAAGAFQPENLTLLVTAPPDVMSMDAFVRGLPASLREATGKVPSPPVTPTGPATPLPSAAGAGMRSQAPTPVASPLPTREVWLAWELPGSYGDQGPAEDLLAGWLEQDLHSEDLVKEESGIQSVSVHLMPGVEAGALLVRILLAAPADPARVAQVVSARVTSLWSREPVARATFADLRSTIEAERLLDEPSQLERVMREASDAALGGRARSAADTMAAVGNVTNGSVAQLAYQNLTADRAHATLFTPETPGRAQAARAEKPHPNLHDHELVPGAAVWDAERLRRLLPAAPEITTVKTTTGLTVITARRPGVSAVAWLGFRGGSADATPPLLVELALRTRPDARQAAALHILTGRGATRDLSFDGVEFRPDRVNEALALLFAKATTMVQEWPGRDGLQRLLAPLAAAEAARGQKSDASFWRALFGDHRDARLVSTDDLDRVTRSDVDAWVGRVHNLRSAALVVVGDVEPAQVQRAAEVLSKQGIRPTWVAELPTPAPPRLRPSGEARTTAVISQRAGTLVDLRIGCLLPTMTVADGAHHALLAEAIEARLNDAIRIEQGDGYGVSVGVQRLRDGATALLLSTFVPETSLPRTLAVLHGHWTRWGQNGFDPSELNVGRWRATAALAAASSDANTVAMELLNVWSAEPSAVGPAALQPDLVSARGERINELFATCRANAVLGLTGDATRIRRALEQTWPDAR